MTRCLKILLVTVLLILLYPVASVSADSGDWVVDGELVYIDNQDVYLSVNPHTLGSSGWVELNINTKTYTGEVDLVWGFDKNSDVKPTRIEVWELYDHNKGKKDKEKDKDEYLDWNKKNKEHKKIDNDIGDWHVSDGISVEAGIPTRMRVWVDLPFSGLDENNGKYNWGIKPHGLTIDEAEAQGKLWIIDPWYNTQWIYRQELVFDNSASAVDLVDFPVLVYINNANFDFTEALATGLDIRFTDSDEITLLEYFIDDWDNVNELATVWVKVPQIDAGSITDSIYMYWGNAAATDTQDKERVFGDWATINDAEFYDNWSADAGVALSLDTDAQEGTYSMNATVAAPAPNTEYTTYYMLPVIEDWSGDGYTLNFWLKADRASTGFSHARVHIHDNDTPRNDRYWDMVFAANTWTYITVIVAEPDGVLGPGLFDSRRITEVHFDIHTDGTPPGTFDYHIDDIEGRWGALYAGAYKDSTNILLSDATRYGNDGAFTGVGEPLWVRRADGLWTLSFDGNNDNVNLGNDDMFNFTSGPFSASYWLEVPTGAPTDRNLLNRGDVTVDGWNIYISGTPRFQFYTSQAAATQVQIAATYTFDDWIHWALVRNGAASTWYRNAINDNVGAGVHIDPLTSARNMMIGSNAAPAGYAEIIISQLKIYSYDLALDWIEADNLVKLDTFITFTVDEGVPLAPVGFTAVASGNDAVDLNWALGTFATTTVIRRGVTAYPVSATDGVGVFNGVGTTFTDNSVDNAEHKYYYRAWGQSEWGVSADYAQDEVGGATMLLIVFGILAIGLTALVYWTRRPAIGFGAAGLWLITALQSYSLTSGTWDIYYGFFWVGIGLTIVIMLEAFVMRPKKSEEEPEEKFQADEYGDKMEEFQDRLNRSRRLSRNGQKERREEKKEQRRIRNMLQ